MKSIDRRELITTGLFSLVLPRISFARQSTIVDFHDLSGEIAGNHGHQAIIPKSNFETVEPITLQIQGTGNHDHSLMISAENLTQLRNGNTVKLKSSSKAGHIHDITFVPDFGVNGMIESNHGHDVFLSPALFSITLHIQGDAGHNHQVVLNPDDLRRIQDGNLVTKATSETDGHSHEVSFQNS